MIGRRWLHGVAVSCRRNINEAIEHLLAGWRTWL